MKILKEDPAFKLHLITENYFFYCDITEADENASTKVFNKENILVSDNFFGNQFLIEVLTGEENEEIIFISDEMKYNKTEILKEYN